MRLLLPTCIILLCISFVLPFTIEESLVGNLPKTTSTLADKNEDEETNQMVVPAVNALDENVVDNIDETNTGEVDVVEAVAASFENKERRWKKRRMNKQEHRHHSHHHKNKKPHHAHKHHRHLSEKKIAKKANRTVSSIRYMERSPQTDRLNKVIDEMLVLFTETLDNDNLTFSLRKEHFHVNMKTFPWMFVVFDEKADTGTNKTVIEGMKNERTSISIPNKQTVKVSAVLTDVEEEEEDTNLEAQKSSNTPDASADTSAETFAITENPIDSSTKEEMRTSEDDDDDEDDEDDDADITPDNITCPENATRFNLTDKPSPVALPDGTVEYNLKMLSEEEIQQRKERSSADPALRLQLINFLMATTSDCDCNINALIFMCCEDEGRKSQPRASKKMKRKHMRIAARRYLRRTKVQLEGIELVKRVGDVLQGSRENSTNHIIDTQLQIGPIRFVMKKVSGFALQSRASFPTLMARLRLTISEEGKLIWARLKPMKVQPHEVIITIQSKDDDNLPTSLEAARLVTYLSHETTSAWNSGYILRRLKRRFKNLFINKTEDKKADAFKKTELNYEEAQKLIQNLVLPASALQLSTAYPMVIEDVTASPSSP